MHPTRARFGVLVKGGKYLEILAVLDCLCCDKTGTLTMGEFQVCDYIVFSDDDDEETKELAFQLLARIERHATHPIAQALKRFSESHLAAITDEDVGQLEILPGVGVKATLPNGSIAMVAAALGPEIVPPPQANEWLANQEGKTVCWLILDGKVLLGASAVDQIRESAFPFVRQLASSKIHVAVLTGDNQSSAMLLHNAIPELSEVHAKLSPQDKVAHIQRLKEEYKTTGLVGDGVNDAAAMAIASIGIAMGVSGAPLAYVFFFFVEDEIKCSPQFKNRIETADCALMDNDLTKITRLLSLSKKTKRVIIQNVS